MIEEYNLINEHNFNILRNHENFVNESVLYQNKVCLKPTSSRGLEDSTVQRSIDLFRAKGATDADIAFVENFYNKHSRSLCCLPKGHSGPCKHKLDTIIDTTFESKLKDCFTTPGDKNEVLFFNRRSRHFPIQLPRKMRLQFPGKMSPFAVPLEFAGTGYTTATAYFDWGALLTLQKGFIVTSEFEPVFDAYRHHADYLSRFYFDSYRLKIVNDEGYLCDPFTFETLEYEWWKQGHRIQFAHILPVSLEEYRTRGLNTIPVTRETNMLQGDRPWTEFIALLKAHIAKH